LNLVFAQSFGLIQHLTWNSPSWSICAEFWTYLVFAAAVFLGSIWLTRWKRATTSLMAITMAGSAAILVIFAHHGMDASYDLGFIRCLYGFLVGHLTYRLFQAASKAGFGAGRFEWASLLVAVFYVSLVGRTEYSFFAPLVFAGVVFIFAFEAGLLSRVMSNRVSDWLGKVSYSIYMWQAFVIFNFIDRPVSILEKITGWELTTTEGVSSALGGEAGKLIVLGGHWLPMLVTLVFLGVLVGVASISYYLVELPGQKLFARLPGWWSRNSRLPPRLLVSQDNAGTLSS
jgi:peptidoglycan/LPS O-acetylase OafA/YrhL